MEIVFEILLEFEVIFFLFLLTFYTHLYILIFAKFFQESFFHHFTYI